MGSFPSKTINLFLCSSPLQVLHAHLVRKQYLADAGDCFIFCEPPIDDRLILPEMWKRTAMLASSRREIRGAPARITENLKTINEVLGSDTYDAVHLLISDTFWLMNNVVLAALFRRSRIVNQMFSFSILDEGAVLYTSAELNLKRSIKSLARSAYLFSHGLPSVLVHNGNSDFRHSLCRAAYCLHPKLLTPTAAVTPSPIDPGHLTELYGDVFGKLDLPPDSSIYISQPLYARIGLSTQTKLVLQSCELLRKQGIKKFYYKSHHFDTSEWNNILQVECGLEPLPCNFKLPVELWARSCNAEVIFGHYSSALLNLKVYGFHGRVIAFGLDKVKQAFHETAQFLAYKEILRNLGCVEMIELIAGQEATAPAVPAKSILEEGS